MFSKGKKTVTREQVLSLYSEEQIILKYFGVDKVPSKICSPLRADKHPSFCFYYGNDDIMWKDFATGEGGTIWTLLCRYLSIPKEGLYETLLKDLEGTKPVDRIITENYTGRSSSRSSQCILSTIKRDWEDYDFEYWKSYGITEKFLKKSGTFPVSYIILKYDSFTSVMKADKYAYVYIENKDDKISQKVYQPFNTRGWKWRSGNDGSVLNLWTMLPEKGEKLVIASSKKDAMCIWCNTGIPAISPQSESASLKKNVMEELKARFGKIYVFYDNDFGSSENHGRVLGKKVCEKHGFIQVEIPEEYGAKDPSDLYKKTNKETFEKVINNLLK